MTIRKILFLILLFNLTYGQSWARHIVGGEITYKCLGLGKYEITLLVYRDCLSTTDLDNTTPNSVKSSITIYRGNSHIPYAILELPTPTIKNIDPNTGDPCLGLPKSNLCLERGYYVMDLSTKGIILPVGDSSYYIVYQRCCRNATISNLPDPSSSGATYFVEITPEAQAVCNNSPVFSSLPPVLICANERLFFDHSAIDVDGDSLVYEMCSPLNGGGQFGSGFNSPSPDPDKYPPYDEILFSEPTYYAQNPLGKTSGWSLNSSTGMLTAVPTVTGQFVVGICVKEYRNGILLSLIRRDFQFNVSVCEPIVVAVLEGQKINQSYNYKVCGDLSLIVDNKSNEQYVDEYFISMNQNNVNTSLTVDNDLHFDFPDYGSYSGYLILNPEKLCTDTAFFNIEVVDIESNFSHDKKCDKGPILFNNFSQSENNISFQKWDFDDGTTSLDSNPSHLFAKAGSYNVTLTISDGKGCTVSFADSVHYYPINGPLNIDPSVIGLCQPASFDIKLMNNNYDVTSYNWTLVDQELICDSICKIKVEKPGVYDLKLHTSTPGGCTADSVYQNYLTVFPLPKAEMNTSRGKLDSKKKDISFEDVSKLSTHRIWTLNNDAISEAPSDLYTLPDTGSFKLDLIIFDKNECSDTTSKLFYVEPFIEVSAPNAIAANGDDTNKKFTIVCNQYVHVIKDLSIFDRNGNKVFHTMNAVPNGPESFWDGSLNGSPLTSGVYIYVADLILYNGEIRSYHGDITLVR